VFIESIYSSSLNSGTKEKPYSYSEFGTAQSGSKKLLLKYTMHWYLAPPNN
jgi:hypothetical protein